MSGAGLRRALPLALAAAALAPAPAGAVIGGTPAPADAYPSVAAVRGCGGTLIAPDRLLTAAHCVDAGVSLTPARPLDVGIGGANPRLEPRVRARAVRVAVHPGWRGARSDAAGGTDLAILGLAEPVAGIAPTPPLRPPLTAQRGVVVGLGIDSMTIDRRRRGPDRATPAVKRVTSPLVLLEAPQTVLGDAQCARFYRDLPYEDPIFDSRTMLCASDPDGRAPLRVPCTGDSGGPLFVGTGEDRAVAGVVSFGQLCGTVGDPAVYARVPAQHAWITDPSPGWAPATDDRPVLRGAAQVGRTVRCETSALRWSARVARLTVRWTRAGGAVGDARRRRARGRTLRLTAGDRGTSVACIAIARGVGGETESVVSAPRIVR